MLILPNKCCFKWLSLKLQRSVSTDILCDILFTLPHDYKFIYTLVCLLQILKQKNPKPKTQKPLLKKHENTCPKIFFGHIFTYTYWYGKYTLPLSY